MISPDALPSNAVRQIEFYFSEENLSRDVYLRGLLEGPSGLPLAILVTFPLLIQYKLTSQQVLPTAEAVCNASPFVEISEGTIKPSLDGLPPFRWPANPRDNSGGVMLLTPIPNCEPSSTWIEEVAKAVRTAVENSTGREVAYVLPCLPAGHCAALLKPFPCDRAICRSFNEVGPLADGSMLPVEIAYGHRRTQYLMMMPSEIRREGQVRKRSKVDRPKMAKSSKHIRIKDKPKVTVSDGLSDEQRWELDGYLQFEDSDSESPTVDDRLLADVEENATGRPTQATGSMKEPSIFTSFPYCYLYSPQMFLISLFATAMLSSALRTAKDPEVDGILSRLDALEERVSETEVNAVPCLVVALPAALSLQQSIARMDKVREWFDSSAAQ
ncbi:hypothetical protein FOL47_000168, partial [Perkinsus chesapeaki]